VVACAAKRSEQRAKSESSGLYESGNGSTEMWIDYPSIATGAMDGYPAKTNAGILRCAQNDNSFIQE